MSKEKKLVDLAAIRARAEAAMKAPWLHGRRGIDEWCTVPKACAACRVMQIVDADFIAAARTDIPALCDEVEALRERNARLEKAQRRIVEADTDCLSWESTVAKSALDELVAGDARLVTT